MGGAARLCGGRGRSELAGNGTGPAAALAPPPAGGGSRGEGRGLLKGTRLRPALPGHTHWWRACPRACALPARGRLYRSAAAPGPTGVGTRGMAVLPVLPVLLVLPVLPLPVPPLPSPPLPPENGEGRGGGAGRARAFGLNVSRLCLLAPRARPSLSLAAALVRPARGLTSARGFEGGGGGSGGPGEQRRRGRGRGGRRCPGSPAAPHPLSAPRSIPVRLPPGPVPVQARRPLLPPGVDLRWAPRLRGREGRAGLRDGHPGGAEP